jgi:hypothetical protein
MPKLDIMLVGNPPQILALWPEERFFWRFEERSWPKPPGFGLVYNGIDYEWTISIAGEVQFPEEGDVISYDATLMPVQLMPADGARKLFPKMEGSKV